MDFVDNEGMGDNFDFGNGQPQDVGKTIIDDIRNSVLVTANPTSKSKAPTLADFKMIIVLGKGTFGKVFLAEFE